MKSGIYQICNLITGDLYIGQAVNLKKRECRHLWELQNNIHHSKYLQNAVNKYGIDNFIFTKLIFCEKEELTSLEQYLVDFYQPKYNMCKEVVTSCLGIKRSSETRRKISSSHKGKVLSDQHKDALSKAHLGLKQSTKTIEKRALKLKGIKRSPEFIANLKRFSIKAVLQICPITQKILAEYDSLVLAGKAVGISGDAIGNQLAGRCLTSGGFKWKYKYD